MSAHATSMITTDDGIQVKATCPVIISASRATDIPAFYSDWFIERLKKGYAKWMNPFNQMPQFISFEKMKAIIFWTKDPSKMMPKLDEIDAFCKNYAFQFTLNDYEQEHIEPNVPSLRSRIQTFKDLSSRLRKDRVVWRFDPLLVSSSVSTQDLCERIEKIGDQIAESTSKLVFSFIDIKNCKKAATKLSAFDKSIRELEIEEKLELSEKIGKLATGWGISAATCGEDIGLEAYGIKQNRCVDDEMMVKCFSDCTELMEFIGAERDATGTWKLPDVHKKDPGQRKACGCIISKDIGHYETCVHNCAYCYANYNHSVAAKNYQTYLSSKHKDSLI